MNTERDTTFYIWDVQWRVRAPQLQTTDEAYIRHFGMPSSTNPDIDRELARQWIDTMITIAQMVDYHRRGIQFKIVYEADIVRIYDHIERHLNLWEENIKNNLNIGDVPIDDLIAMNEFANTMFPIARPQLKTQAPSSSFMRTIARMGFSKNPFIAEKEEEEDNKPLRRRDMADVFKNVTQGAGRWN